MDIKEGIAVEEEEEVVAAEVVVEMVEEEMEIGVVLTRGSDCINLCFI